MNGTHGTYAVGATFTTALLVASLILAPGLASATSVTASGSDVCTRVNPSAPSVHVDPNCRTGDSEVIASAGAHKLPVLQESSCAWAESDGSIYVDLSCDGLVDLVIR